MPKLQNTLLVILDRHRISMEASTSLLRSQQREILTQCTLHTTVKQPDLVPNWVGFRPGKV